MCERFYLLVVGSIGRYPFSFSKILVICDSGPRWMTNYTPSYLIWSMNYCIGVVFVVPKLFTTKTNVNK